MTSQNIFSKGSTEASIARLEKLTADAQPQWGKMNPAQMLAHLNVAYAITFGEVEVSYNFFSRFMLKLFVKDIVVGKKPYTKNSRTAPIFVVDDERDFEKEKSLLIANIKKTAALGSAHFEGKESASFGKLTAEQWSTQFQKHMDHHFTQFNI